MADSKISALTAYTTPIGADTIPIVDSTNNLTKKITIETLHQLYENASTSSQGAGFSSDTYLTGSNISIPSGAPYVGTTYRLVFTATKTGAGTAAPTLNIRFGTNGTTADSSICSLALGAGTAAADTGVFTVQGTFRSVGSGTSAVLQGYMFVVNRLASTGITNATKNAVTTGGGFNSTTASSIIGASLNAGASASWTVQLVRAELIL